jgi:hypothetical protein
MVGQAWLRWARNEGRRRDEGMWLGAETFVWFDKKVVEMLTAQGFGEVLCSAGR